MVPFNYPEDEDELMDQDPYTSISNRISSDGIDEDSSGSALMPTVKNVIATRKGLSLPTDLSQDPLMKQYEQEQADLNKFRTSKLEADQISNLGQAFQSFARGGNKPEDSDALYQNLGKQGQEILKSKQEDLDRRQKIINSIESRNTRKSIADNADAYRNLALSVREKQVGQVEKQKKDRLDSMNIGRANALFSDPSINRETMKLNASRSAQALIKGIESGELKSSKNIRNQLTTIMSTIEMGGPGAVHDREAMGVNSLYTKVQDALAFAQSNPNNSIPPNYLEQIKTEANALGDRAALNYKTLLDAKLAGADLSGGNPDVDPGQVYRLANNRRNTFLTVNGYDASTGEPLHRKSNENMVKLSPGESGGLIPSANAGGSPKIVKRQYSPSKNKTKLTYDNGNEVFVDGKQ